MIGCLVVCVYYACGKCEWYSWEEKRKWRKRKERDVGSVLWVCVIYVGEYGIIMVLVSEWYDDKRRQGGGKREIVFLGYHDHLVEQWKS